MLFLLLVAMLGVDEPIIVEAESDLCAEPQLANNCGTADGSWGDPYIVDVGTITETALGCGGQAAIAICTDVAIELRGGRVDVDTPDAAVALHGQVRLRDVAIHNGAGAAFENRGNAEFIGGTTSTAGQGSQSSGRHLTMDGTTITGTSAGPLLTTTTQATFIDVDVHGLATSGIRASGPLTVEGGRFHNMGVSRPHPEAGLWRVTLYPALEIQGSHATVRNATFHVTDTGVWLYAGGTTEMTGNTFMGGDGTRALAFGNEDTGICDLLVHHNSFLGLGAWNYHADCLLHLDDNWWGTPDGPPELGDNIRVQRWLHTPPADVPGIRITSVVLDGTVLIRGTAEGDIDRIVAATDSGTTSHAAGPEWAIQLDRLGPDLRLMGCGRDCSMPIAVPAAATPEPLTMTAADSAPKWPLAAAIGLPIMGLALATTVWVNGRTRRFTVALQDALAAKQSEVDDVREDVDKFISGAAHDLRGPIVNLVISTQIAAKRAAAGQDVGEILQTSAASGQRLNGLVEQLMAYGRAGYDTGHTTTASLADTIQHVVDSIETKHTSIVLKGSDQPITSDHGAISRIVQNLVSNAVRAAPSGRIQIEWTLAPFSIEVRDQGPGIPEAILAHLFQPLVRGAHGAGIGLATAHRLAGRMGMDLELITTGPEGTTFRLSAP